MILFDIRSDDSQEGFIKAVNDDLDSLPGSSYLAQFGPVCSPQWWACLDRGELFLEVLSGLVTHTGPRRDVFDEIEDVVEIVCDEQEIVYDRLDHWATHPIRVGDLIRITSIQVELPTRHGSTFYRVDLKAEWFLPSELSAE